MPKKGHKMSEEHKKKIALANKGKKRTPEMIEKMRETTKNNPTKYWKGKKLSEEHRKKLSESHKGYKFSEERKKRASEAFSGEKHPFFGKKHSKESKKKMAIANTGRIKSIEERRKLSEALKGEKCYLWKGGITAKNTQIRHSIEYKMWREAVFARDNWTCQNKKCKKRGGKLEAHHIKPFSHHEDLIFEVENGLTLCKKCHKETDTYGFKALKYSEKLCQVT